MADGSIVFETSLDNKKLEKELMALSKKISETERKLSEKKNTQSALEIEFASAKEEAKKTEDAIARISARISEIKSAAEIAGIKNPIGLEDLQSELNEQESILAAQNKEAERLGNQYAKVTDTVTELTDNLGRAKAESGKIQHELAKSVPSANAMSGAMERMQSSARRFALRLREVVRSALVFTVISQGFAALRNWMGETIKTNNDAVAAIGRLKGSLLTLAQPLVDVVIPAFTAFVNILAAVIGSVVSFLSMLGGKTAKQSAASAKALNKQKQAIGGVGSAAKEAAKNLASFDEINRLSDNSASGGGGGGGASGIEPDFSAFDTGDYTKKVDELMAYLGGALLAIGAILTFSGANIPLGLGLMAVGALSLASAAYENWDVISEKLQGPLGTISAVLGTALLVLGAILAFSGASIPLGIALMAAGAAGLAPVVAVNWEKITGFIKKNIKTIVTIVSAALLVLGAILVFSGASIPLGIGLLIAGATGLASVAAVNWDEIKGFVEENINTIVTVVGVAFLALGAILALSGANIPLGIGLLVAGATVLASTVAVNWDSVETALKGPIGRITAIVSAALLVLGIILTCVGIFPLGIGLLAAGAIGLATTAAANWDSIVTALQGPIGKITALASGALLVLGIILTCVGIFPLGIALIAAGAVGLVTVAALNWNAILEKCKEVWEGIKNWWNTSVKKYFTVDYWKELGRDIINGLLSGLKSIWQSVASWVSDKTAWIGNMFSSAKNQASGTSGSYSSGGGHSRVALESAASMFSPQSIPALARGAVIPPNREFLAVLGDQRHGTNIEAPLETIQEAVALVMNDFIDSNMAGHEATVGVLRDILAAVLGIEIGDDVIAQAVNRYNRKMAVVEGGTA